MPTARRHFALLSLVLLAAVACKKENKTEEWKKHVRFEWLQPQKDASYAAGDTLFIAASVSSELDLHGYTLDVYRTDSTASYRVVNRFRHTHGKELLLHEVVYCDSLGAGRFALRLRLHADHEDNTMLLERDFQILSSQD